MNNRLFYGLIAVIILGSVGVVLASKNNHPLPARLGTVQTEEKDARSHIPGSQAVSYSQTIPTSGPHGQEAPWGYSPTQLPNQAIIHNMEHGGIIVSYRPDVDKQTVNKLVSLYTKPWSDPKFSPIKAIVMPRADQKDPIVLVSWNRMLALKSYDQTTLENYYFTNEGKSPEPRGV